MGGAMLSKSLIQYSVEWGCVLSLLFDLRPNYGGGFEDNGNLLQRVPCMPCYTQCPHPCSRPPRSSLLLETPRHSWACLGQVCLCPPRVGPQSCVSSGGSIVRIMVTSSKRAYAIPMSAAPRAPVPVAVHC